jgi:Cu/Ag efflux pump CusA
MVSSTILTLLVIPVLYAMWRWRTVKQRQQDVPT